MSTEVKHRRGTAAQHATFTGAEAEITYDSTNKQLRVHDGATAGGIPLARKDQTGMGVSSFSGLASVTPDQVAVGETVRVIETGAVYQRVSTGGDLDYTGTGGVRFDVLPLYGPAIPTVLLAAFRGDWTGATDAADDIQAVLDRCKAKGYNLDMSGCRIALSRTVTITGRTGFRVIGDSMDRCGWIAIPGFVAPDDDDDDVPLEYKVRSFIRLQDCASAEFSDMNFDGYAGSDIYAFDLMRTGGSTGSTASMSRNRFLRIGGNKRVGVANSLRGGFMIHDRGIEPDNNSENVFDQCWFENSKSMLSLRNRNSLDNLLDHCVMMNSVGVTDGAFVETLPFTYLGNERGGGGFNIIGGYANVAGGITSGPQTANCAFIRLRGDMLHDINVHGFNIEDNLKLLDVNIITSSTTKAINLFGLYQKGGINGANGSAVSVAVGSGSSNPLTVNFFGGAANQGRSGVIYDFGDDVTVNFYGHVISASNINGTGTVRLFGTNQTPGTVTVANTITLELLSHAGTIAYNGRTLDLAATPSRFRSINRYTTFKLGEGIQLDSANGAVSSHFRMLNQGNPGWGDASTPKEAMGLVPSTDVILATPIAGPIRFFKVTIGGTDRYIPAYNLSEITPS